MSGTAVHCRRRYFLCKGTARKGAWRRQGKGCYQQADSIITGKTVRVCQKDRSEPAVKLYSGRASADHRFNSCISAGFHVFDGSVLEKKLSSLVNQDYTIVGGVDAIVEILNSVDRGTEKHIMETLEVEEPELADEIRKKMFVFEDILSLDDRAIQRVLRDVDNADLALALKGATEEVQNVILNNLSKRLAVMIREDMDFMGPVRMKDVEEAQQKIVNVIRKLEDSAEIVIARGGGDEIIV